MKRLYFLISLILLVCCAEKEDGLKYSPDPLPAPVISVDGSTIRWEAIPGVTNYVLEFNGEVYGPVADTYIDLRYVGAGEYSVRVMASGDGRNKSDSEWSNTVLASASGVLDNAEIKITQPTFKEAYEGTAQPPVMTWTSVAKADGYIIRVDGTEVAVTEELEFDLSAYPGARNLSVQAYSGDRSGVHSLSDEIERTAVVKAYGEGTEASPWALYDTFDWDEFAALVNAKKKFTGEFVSLGADIDFAGSAPVGAGLSSTARFEGVFYGKGFCIKNITLGGTSASAAGLFVCLDGTVNDLAVENAAVTMASSGVTKGSVISGGDTGPDAKILNCTVRNSTISCRGYGSMIAACVKSGAAEISGCVVDGCAITGSDSGAGAIVAYLAYPGAKVVDCVVSGSSVSAKGAAGSAVGTGAAGYVLNCIAENNVVTTVSNLGTGALVGATATTASGLHIVNNLTKGCTVVNKTTVSEAYLSLLLGKEAVTAGKVQNNVVVSGKIDHVCTSKPRIGFFVGTKGAGLWDFNYYGAELASNANQGSGGSLGPIGGPAFEGSKAGGSKSVGTDGTSDVALSDLVAALNGNITAQNYAASFPEIRNWVSGADGWPTFEYNN